MTILYGVPYPHGPEEHAVFSIATEDYPVSALEDASVEQRSGGFLDGVPGTLLQNRLGSDAPEAGVCVTPAHPPGPDFEGHYVFSKQSANTSTWISIQPG